MANARLWAGGAGALLALTACSAGSHGTSSGNDSGPHAEGGTRPTDARAPDAKRSDARLPDAGDAAAEASAPPNPCQTGQTTRDSQPSSEEFNGPFASWKSVKTFGAKGDGTTDDTAAIQSALNALQTVSTNDWSTLYFPPGTYVISAQLTTTRSSNNDYQGSDIVGDDPTTTILQWAGPMGGTMLSLDAWYNKVSRLTFDGKSLADIGIARAPTFATYGELSDLQFQDFGGAGILLGDATSGGIAEQALLRNRFYRCVQGVSTYNYNTLDIYIWNSYFEESQQAIRNSTGAFHAVQNRFSGSTESDLAAYTNMQSAIIGNTSVGSAAFLANFEASAVFQGNLVYATATDGFGVLNVQATLLDNVLVLPDGGEASEVQDGTLLAGNVFVGKDRWPFVPVPQNYNHGVNASNVIGHPIQMAVDGDPTTYSVQLQLIAPSLTANGLVWNTAMGTTQTVTKYAVTQGGPTNDTPQEFTLLGSNDFGNSFTTLDTQAGQSFTAGQRIEFAIANPGAYSLYKWNVTAVDGPIMDNEGWLSVAELELLDATGKDIARDPDGLVTACNEPWGSMFAVGTTFMPDAACGAAPVLQPFPFLPKVARPIVDVTAFTSAAIQSAIDQAAKMDAGSKPVVHLPKGNYAIASSINVPANVELSIVGDGASVFGTSLNWSGSSADPVMVLAGPSRATVRDMSISSQSGPGLVVHDADQPGGRVYGNQLNCGGFGYPNNIASIAYDIDSVEQSDVTMIAFGMSSFSAGVRVTGGPLRQAGKSAPGQVSFLTGSSSAGFANYDVRKNGQLLVNGSYFEQDNVPMNPVSVLDLESASSGTLALAAATLSVTDPSLPIVDVNGFAGTLTLVDDLMFVQGGSTAPIADLFQFEGSGQATQVFGANNTYQNPPSDAPAQMWLDTTNPAGAISEIASGVPDYTDKTVGASPDGGFVQASMSALGALRVELPYARAAGSTDARLIRVLVVSGNGQTACAILAN